MEDELEGVRREVRELGPRSMASVPVTATSVRFDMPTFGAAACERPMRFMQTLLKYIQAVGAHGANFKLIVDEALKGPAHDW